MLQNPSTWCLLWENDYKRICIFYQLPTQVANKILPYAMAVHGLATQDAKAPAARVLVYQFRSIMVSASELILLNLLHSNMAIISTECIHHPSTDSVLTGLFILCYFYYSDFIRATDWWHNITISHNESNNRRAQVLNEIYLIVCTYAL